MPPNILPSRPIHPHIQSKCPNRPCGASLEYPVPFPPPLPGAHVQIRCFSCQTVYETLFAPPSNPSATNHRPSSTSTPTTTTTSPPPPPNANANSSSGKKSRLIGTQERPFETTYYDLLNVSPLATTDEIKKSYRRLAIQYHPDKNLNDPTSSAERFKEISIAYQTLSDPELRRKYNEFGAKGSTPEGGFVVDPEEIFGKIFGGERFLPIIGKIGLAGEMKAAMQEGEEEEEGSGIDARDEKGKLVLTEEEKAIKDERARKRAVEKAAAREARISSLVSNLILKLSIFSESALSPTDTHVLSSFRQLCTIEASQLVLESYGYDLLQTVGFVYVQKSKQFLASTQSLFGFGGWIHNVQGKYHVFSETVSTLKSAIELKNVFDQIQAKEREGKLTEEEKRKLEEQAAEKGLQALFKGTKLEVEAVLREVCDRVLDKDKAVMRAVALQVLGEAYLSVKKEGGGGLGDDSEYVRVETKGSRGR
ncbi:DnaJ domain containing protein [Amanita muscaria]